MISQYHVGAVLLFTANNNIVDKQQLKGLIQQMQSNSSIPLAVAIDQEGGTVDRLQSLDGPRPAAADIGATNDPSKAKAQGIQDAQDLASYGFNLNLAPVVDVTNVYNPQLYGRTYGTTPALVTKMAEAYLQGLQQSGKVLGTLKHFPGLGDVGVDPHSGVPNLYRSKSDLEAIDWAPYRALIQQGNVHAVLVTHEIVHAIDDSKPSSLSYKVVTGILRDELGFQGVVITDSLTMEGITAYYTEGQAAVLAVEAGSDLLMGPSTPAGVATMIEGIKQAIASGTISQQRIDDSVRRILMLKYQMGLLTIPAS
jgi:beta-N-acetylhexosaminidase